MSDAFLEKVARRWDDLLTLVNKIEAQGYELYSMDDLLNLFDSGTLNPNDYEFPCGDDYEMFKQHVERGYYDIEPKLDEPEYTREYGKPWTYPPREFVEHYDRGEFSKCHFNFAEGPEKGYERLKADILRGLYD